MQKVNFHWQEVMPVDARYEIELRLSGLSRNAIKVSVVGQKGRKKEIWRGFIYIRNILKYPCKRIERHRKRYIRRTVLKMGNSHGIDLTEFSAVPWWRLSDQAQNLIKLGTSSCNMYRYMTGLKSSRNSCIQIQDKKPWEPLRR